jgi:hypothetical protein
MCVVLRPPHALLPGLRAYPHGELNHRGTAGSAALYPDAGDGPEFITRTVACQEKSQTQADRKIRVSVVRKPTTNRPRPLFLPRPVRRERVGVRASRKSRSAPNFHGIQRARRGLLALPAPRDAQKRGTLDPRPKATNSSSERNATKKPPRATARPRRLTRNKICPRRTRRNTKKRKHQFLNSEFRISSCPFVDDPFPLWLTV